MAGTLSILDAMDRLFRGWFRPPGEGEQDSWRAWRALLSVVFALPLTDEQAAIFRECTGRTTIPEKPFQEIWLCCGRRSGKSLVLALVATYLATFVNTWASRLVPGERGTILVLASDRKQARTIFRYIQGMLELPLFKQKNIVDKVTTDTIELRKRISIEVATASYRSVRGYTIIACLCDEIAFWRTDDGAANPDGEILAALRPAMLTMPGAMLFCASSPYARRGEMWKAFRKYHGVDDAQVLFWRAPTLTMNPTVPRHIIEDAFEEDHASASAEFGAEFRSDIAAFVASEVVEACTAPGRYEIPYASGCGYQAFCDPSGGSSDSMTLSIAHRGNNGIAILDCIREIKAPFSPDDATEQLASTLKSYGLRQVTGDKYAGEWPSDRFRANDIRYIPSEKPKSDIYKELLPILNGRRAELLDNKRLHAQLLGLERRTARGGRDSIDHAPGAHDDVANAVAGSLVMCARPSAMEIWRKLALPTLEG